MKKAFDKTFAGNAVDSEFKSCGLYPFNPDAVNYSKCDLAATKQSQGKPERRNNLPQEHSSPNHSACLNHMERFFY